MSLRSSGTGTTTSSATSSGGGSGGSAGGETSSTGGASTTAPATATTTTGVSTTGAGGGGTIDVEPLDCGAEGWVVENHGPPSNRVNYIILGDGYDATRLLLPGFRRFAAQHLGESYYAAIPHRDALVLWAKDCSRDFSTRLVAHLGSQFRGEPYPLTDRIFEVGPDGIRAAALAGAALPAPPSAVAQ